MKLFTAKSHLRNYLADTGGLSQSIGFVPTMGALHQGHISLTKQCVSENEVSVVSIFVNPTQFNNPNDLTKYPRTLQQDLELLEASGCHVVFAPENSEIYPEPDSRVFDFNGLDTAMEGAFRPGHFNGVAQVVSKLFEIVQPDKAYFGQKDFQQLSIIKYINANYLKHLNIDIIACPTIRESDGLAMSSRNVRLSPQHRVASVAISQILFETQRLALHGSPVEQILQYAANAFEEQKLLKLEYFEIVDNKTLRPVSDFLLNTSHTACVAAYAGDVRLIDNISL